MSDPKKDAPASSAATPPTTLTAPPAAQQMVAPDAAVKKVKIRAERAISFEGVTMAPGDVALVSEAMAKEFCDRKIEGNYAFGGERSEATSDRHVIVRAVRV